MNRRGPHALVTGAGTGIGRAVAKRLSAAGYTLTLCGRRSALLEETALQLNGPAQIAPLDITDGEAVTRVLAESVRAQGKLSIVVANSGLCCPNGPEDPGGDRFAQLVATNLLGTYSCLRGAVPYLEGNSDRPARLIAVSSILARIGVPGYSGYCASKAGILGLIRAMAAELAPHATVNTVCPGWVDTEMAREGLELVAMARRTSFDEAYSRAMQQVPMGRMCQPEEVAGLVVWLTTDDAATVTGQGIDINGGKWMG